LYSSHDLAQIGIVSGSSVGFDVLVDDVVETADVVDVVAGGIEYDEFVGKWGDGYAKDDGEYAEDVIVVTDGVE
jgi:hypothetical protein